MGNEDPVQYVNIPTDLLPFVNDSVKNLLDGSSNYPIKVPNDNTAIIFTEWMTITVRMTENENLIIIGRSLWHSADILKLCAYVDPDAPISISPVLFRKMNTLFTRQEQNMLTRAIMTFSTESKNFSISLIG